MKSRVQQFAQRIGSKLFSYEDISKKELINELNPFVVDRKDGKKGLLTEEVQELLEALEKGDILEVTDAVVDIQYYVYQMISWLEIAGIDFNGAMNAVCDNNDSKYTTSKELAWQWAEDYRFKGYHYDVNIVGIESYLDEYACNDEYTTYYCLKDSEGKVKKPIDFIPVDLSSFIPDKFKEKS